jgi:hypothetical protein
MYEDAVGVHPEHNVIIIRVLSDIQLVLRTLTNYMFATVKMRLNEDYKINQLALHLNSNTREVNKKKKRMVNKNNSRGSEIYAALACVGFQEAKCSLNGLTSRRALFSAPK